MQVAAAASAIGTVVSVAGARAQAKGQAAASRYNAKIAQRNAATADISADWRKLSNKIEENEFRERFRSLQAATNVAISKGGVMSGTGTALAVAMKSAEEADNEIAMRDLNANMEAQQFKEQGINERLNANLQRIYARNYLTAGKFKMASAATSGVSRSAYLLAKK